LGAQPSTHDRVQIPKAAQIVASRIRRRIVDGELKRGERLASEAELASTFAVSRPVVREALRVLESEHLIKLERGSRHGAKVCDPTAEIVTRATGIALRMKRATLADIFDARAVGEAAAARFAALHRPREASKVLGRHVAYQISVIDDQIAFQRSHGEFHRLLLEECGNITLTVTGLALQGIMAAHLDLIRDHSPGTTETRKLKLWCVHSYQRLTDLIERRDGPEAEAHWRLHMNAITQYWIDRASQLSILQIAD
jgi:DNA-binding FadR family transcriptional regulator